MSPIFPILSVMTKLDFFSVLLAFLVVLPLKLSSKDSKFMTVPNLTTPPGLILPCSTTPSAMSNFVLVLFANFRSTSCCFSCIFMTSFNALEQQG